MTRSLQRALAFLSAFLLTASPREAGASDAVDVQIGDLPPGQGVTITFDALVNSPFPLGVNELSVQGTVTGSNVTPEVTDDPDTPAPGDATVTPVLRPEIAVVPASVEFGRQDIDDGGIQTTVMILNEGNDTLNFIAPGLVLSGADSLEFSITGDPASASVAAGASREVTVAFDPEFLNTRTGDLTVTTDDNDDSVVAVPLQGFGFQTTTELVDTLIGLLPMPASPEKVDVNEDGGFDSADIVTNVNVIDNP